MCRRMSVCGKKEFKDNTAAFMIHGAVHAAREDVMCAAHSHTIYARTWSAMGRELDMLTQDSCAFWRDHVVYDQFAGVVLAENESKEIAKALGSNKVCALSYFSLYISVYGFQLES